MIWCYSCCHMCKKNGPIGNVKHTLLDLVKYLSSLLNTCITDNDALEKIIARRIMVAEGLDLEMVMWIRGLTTGFEEVAQRSHLGLDQTRSDTMLNNETPLGCFLSQRKYTTEIFERAGMVSCNSSMTPIDTESKLGDDGDLVCLYMHDPRKPHFSALKQVLRSTSGYCVFLGNNLLSWSSTRQPTLSRSSAEAEYRGVANAVVETCWLRNLLRELHTPLSSATLVYCDNVSAVYLSSNLVQHQRTKNIEIDIHFVRDLVAVGEIRILHVPSRYQYADIFTKRLPSTLFEEFHTSLSVQCPPTPTEGSVRMIFVNLYIVP
ncbi:ribonuclease H-like domain-containing protein [Tanacetum coccineum]